MVTADVSRVTEGKTMTDAPQQLGSIASGVEHQPQSEVVQLVAAIHASVGNEQDTDARHPEPWSTLDSPQATGRVVRSRVI